MATLRQVQQVPALPVACLLHLGAIHPRAHLHLVLLVVLAAQGVRGDLIPDLLDNMVLHIDQCIQDLQAGLRIATPLPLPLDPHGLHRALGATDHQATTDHREAGAQEVLQGQDTVRKVRHSKECE